VKKVAKDYKWVTSNYLSQENYRYFLAQDYSIINRLYNRKEKKMPTKKKLNYLALDGKKINLSKETVTNLKEELQPKKPPVFQMDTIRIEKCERKGNSFPIRIGISHNNNFNIGKGVCLIHNENLQSSIYTVTETKEIISGLQKLVRYIENERK
jgi:hypothetical protein